MEKQPEKHVIPSQNKLDSKEEEFDESC